MKKSMFAIWAIIVIFIGLVITQNQDFFLLDQSLRLNLWVLGEYATPVVPTAVIFLVAFIAGLVISYLFNLPEKFRSKRTIKKLHAMSASSKDKASVKKDEVKELKENETKTPEAPEKGNEISDNSPADATIEQKPAASFENPKSEESDKQP
jgi:uncharacterized integral membrane protein